MPATLRSELRNYVQQIRDVQEDARALVSGLADEQANWRPARSRWSVLQCLDHVTQSLALYLPAMERMVGEARAREAAGLPPYREGWFTRRFVAGMEPPVRRRLPAPRRVRPAPQLAAAEVLSEFVIAHDRLIATATRADGISLQHARMTSPFTRLIRFTLGQALALNAGHARRHLWQAWRVRGHPDFPG